MKWLAFLALLLAAAAGGYAFRGERNQAAITAAETRASVCVANATGNAAALADTQQLLADLRDRHDQALAFASAALDARAEEINALNAAAEDLAAKIRKLTHEDPDCAALARLPVCAAVSSQLWPVRAANASGTAGTH